MFKVKKVGLLSLVAIQFLTILFSFLVLTSPQKVLAAQQANWIDANYIDFQGVRYEYEGSYPDGGSGGDTKLIFKATNDKDKCTDKIKKINTKKAEDEAFREEHFGYIPGGNEAIWEHNEPTAATGCKKTDEKIDLKGEGYKTSFYWKDGGNVTLLIQNKGFLFNKEFNIYTAAEGGNCRDTIQTESGAATGTLIAREVTRNGPSRDAAYTYDIQGRYKWHNLIHQIKYARQENGCVISNPISIRIAGGDKIQPIPPGCPGGAAGTPDPAVPCPDPTANADDPKAADPSCESILSDPLSWIGCQILNSANKAIRRIDAAISQELAFSQKDGTGFELSGNSLTDFDNKTSPGKEYYQVWSTFRYLATAIIILAAVAMVIGQAISFGPFDAYTVKKLLPKILAAVVFINLSWSLCVVAIQFTNGLGYGIRAIMYAPFEQSAGTSIDQVFNASTFEGLAGTGLVVGGFAVAASLGIMGILSIAISALLALAVGFAIIILRKIVIILLVLTAPVAIASMILPNTDKLWKFWKESFSKGLMMFPIIMALLASGRIFSYITAVAEKGQDLQASSGTNQAVPIIGNGKGLLVQLIAVLAYFIPYFLIPGTFKLAGGALTAVTGKLNDRSKGLFDRNKNWRGSIKKQRANERQLNNYKNLSSDSAFKRGRATLGVRKELVGQGVSPAIFASKQKRERMAMLMNSAEEKGLKQIDEEANSLIASKLRGTPGSGHGKVLSAIVNDSGSSQAVKKAALEQLVQKDMGEVRKLHEQGLATNASTSKAWNEVVDKNYPTIKEKAPDLVGKSLQGTAPEAMTAWDASTWAKWQGDFASDAVASAAGDVGATQRLATRTEQARQLKTNDRLQTRLTDESRALLTGEAFVEEKTDQTGAKVLQTKHQANADVQRIYGSI